MSIYHLRQVYPTITPPSRSFLRFRLTQSYAVGYNHATMKTDLRASVETMYRRRSKTSVEPRPQTAPEPATTFFEIHQQLPRNKGGGGTLPDRQADGTSAPYRLKTECDEFIKRDCVTTDWTKATCPKCRRNAPIAAPIVPAALVAAQVPKVARKATKGIVLPCRREHGVSWHGTHLLVGCKCCENTASGERRCGAARKPREPRDMQPQKWCRVCSLRAERVRYLRDY